MCKTKQVSLLHWSVVYMKHKNHHTELITMISVAKPEKQ
jgi:hypothetical protein